MTAVTRFELVVPGEPVPLERARKGRGGRWYLPRRSRVYRDQVQAEWMAAGRPSLGDGPLAVSAQFYTSNTHADTDNLLKAQLDALNKLAWADDRQVTCFSGVHKLPVDERGARVELQVWQTAGRVAA